MVWALETEAASGRIQYRLVGIAWALSARARAVHVLVLTSGAGCAIFAHLPLEPQRADTLPDPIRARVGNGDDRAVQTTAAAVLGHALVCLLDVEVVVGGTDITLSLAVTMGVCIWIAGSAVVVADRVLEELRLALVTRELG